LIHGFRFFYSKASPKPEKGKPKKVQAPSNINKMDTNGLDYTKKTDAGKVVCTFTLLKPPLSSFVSRKMVAQIQPLLLLLDLNREI
jgi:hypothetical protein